MRFRSSVLMSAIQSSWTMEVISNSLICATNLWFSEHANGFAQVQGKDSAEEGDHCPHNICGCTGPEGFKGHHCTVSPGCFSHCYTVVDWNLKDRRPQMHLQSLQGLWRMWHRWTTTIKALRLVFPFVRLLTTEVRTKSTQHKQM